VAYAIGRTVGPAVTRNRLRRRLRALLAMQEPRLPAGLYLIGATPAAAGRSFAELALDLDRLLSRITPDPGALKP
jgi:ribonuclease P protein component